MDAPKCGGGFHIRLLKNRLDREDAFVDGKHKPITKEPKFTFCIRRSVSCHLKGNKARTGEPRGRQEADCYFENWDER
jgi:hypothetical protein